MLLRFQTSVDTPACICSRDICSDQINADMIQICISKELQSNNISLLIKLHVKRPGSIVLFLFFLFNI